MKKAVLFAGALTLALGMGSQLAPAGAQAPDMGPEFGQRVPERFEPVSARPGEIVWNSTGTAGVEVPGEPGKLVAISSIPALGEPEMPTLEIVTDEAGRAFKYEHAPEAPDLHLGPAADTTGRSIRGKRKVMRNLNGCSDGSWAHLTGRWTGNFTLYTSSHKPSNILQSSFESNNLTGVGTMTSARTNCAGWGDFVETVVSNGGTTSLHSQIPVDGSGNSYCSASPDGVSVSSFGAVTPGDVGKNCRWGSWQGSVYVYSSEDSRLSVSYNWTGGACSGSTYVISAILSHEHGHGFGLDHPGGSHPTLTMNSSADAYCSTAMNWLGLGDLNSLANKGY